MPVAVGGLAGRHATSAVGSLAAPVLWATVASEGGLWCERSVCMEYLVRDDVRRACATHATSMVRL